MQLGCHIFIIFGYFNILHKIIVIQIDRQRSGIIPCIIGIDGFIVHIEYDSTAVFLHYFSITKAECAVVIFVERSITIHQSRSNHNSSKDSFFWKHRIPETIRALFQIQILFLEDVFQWIALHQLDFTYTISGFFWIGNHIHTKFLCVNYLISS